MSTRAAEHDATPKTLDEAVQYLETVIVIIGQRIVDTADPWYKFDHTCGTKLDEADSMEEMNFLGGLSDVLPHEANDDYSSEIRHALVVVMEMALILCPDDEADDSNEDAEPLYESDLDRRLDELKWEITKLQGATITNIVKFTHP